MIFPSVHYGGMRLPLLYPAGSAMDPVTRTSYTVNVTLPDEADPSRLLVIYMMDLGTALSSNKIDDANCTALFDPRGGSPSRLSRWFSCLVPQEDPVQHEAIYNVTLGTIESFWVCYWTLHHLLSNTPKITATTGYGTWTSLLVPGVTKGDAVIAAGMSTSSSINFTGGVNFDFRRELDGGGRFFGGSILAPASGDLSITTNQNVSLMSAVVFR